MRTRNPGRGSGRGGGRGGRGTEKKTTERELKFAPYNKQNSNKCATYATVKDQLLHRIQQSYRHGRDIAQTLRQGSKVTFKSIKPKLKKSDKTDTEENELETEEFQIAYRDDLKYYNDRRRTLDENTR